jgi:hypothetical protein
VSPLELIEHQSLQFLFAGDIEASIALRFPLAFTIFMAFQQDIHRQTAIRT